MATKKESSGSSGPGAYRISASVEELLLSALERGGDSYQTGRYLVTFKEGTEEESRKSLGGMRIADARDFEGQAATLESLGDADALYFPEIHVALISGDTALEHSLGVQTEIAADSPIASIDPEYFQFALPYLGPYLTGIAETPEGNNSEYLRGFLRAAEIIARDLHPENGYPGFETEEQVQVLGATWGLGACKIPSSQRSGNGIRVAVLDTGFDMGHPDFTGRAIQGMSFVGQAVQDLNGHGTHVTGTACGPKAPAGTHSRYGTDYRSPIFAGKVLDNTGAGTQSSVLAGMNWAIASRCPVISMSLGGSGGPHPAYTAAGQAALNNGCLVIAAAGNSGDLTGAPANSPTIMSVASLDKNLKPSSFSCYGKIEIAAPGRDVFSCWPRPRKYNTLSGTSMATPHVAGCAALWAETSPNLRGLPLWQKLQATAKRLRFPAARVGAGIVQAPV
jgi:subtilisin